MIELRDLRPDDRDRLLYWRNLPEVADYLYTDHLVTEEEHDRWFAHIQVAPTFRYWVITFANEDVGLVNLYDIDSQNQRCSWGFYLASPSVRGRGVGSYVEYAILKTVFEELALNKLCCEVLGFNSSVIKMHQKFGFQQEGILREHIIKAGKALDVVVLSQLRSEWLANRDEIAERMKRIEERFARA